MISNSSPYSESQPVMSSSSSQSATAPTAEHAAGTTVGLRSSMETLLMQTLSRSASSSLLLSSTEPTTPSITEVASRNSLPSPPLFPPPLVADDGLISKQSDETLCNRASLHPPTTPMSDTTTDLVAALLAVLQRQARAETSPPSSSTRGLDAPLVAEFSSDESSKIMTPTTAATTTAATSPSTSMGIDMLNLEKNKEDNMMNSRGSSILNVDVIQQTPRTTVQSESPLGNVSSSAEQGMSTPETSTSFPSILGGESASQWSGLSDLISSLLTTTSTNPLNLPTGTPALAFSVQFPFATSTNSPNSSSFLGAALSDIAAATGAQVADMSSPEQDTSSILSGLSSSISANLTSPGNASLASGLSSTFLADRVTVGDFTSILSPSNSISALATPTASSPDLSSPLCLNGVAMTEQSTSQGDPIGGGTSTLSEVPISVKATTGIVLPTHAVSQLPRGTFNSAIFSSSKTRAPDCSRVLAASDRSETLNQRVAEEFLEVIEERPVGERTPESNAVRIAGDGNSGDSGVCSETPRALLFHPDGSLNLEFFKVFPCKNESHVHDRKNCPFHHSQRDRRRQPVTYKAEQCEDHFDLEGDFICACPTGDNCDKCHNRHELLYHPDIYKQRFCSSYNHLECHRGRFCAFAHTREEIRCDLFTEKEERVPKSDFFMKKFKTLWCPYGVQHDWHGCLYAHTYQDCRRSPSIGYGSEPCPYWQKDLHSADYQKRCPFGPRCPYSHGSKEQLYHPAYYKTMPCADYKTKRACPRSDLCAFYHDVSEKRPVLLQSGTSTPRSERSIEEASGGKLYDYTRPIPNHLMDLLQPNFMRPPLFNLDDFEAFGHASRVGSGRRESHGSGHNTPLSSSIRPTTFPQHPYPESPSYPSIYHQNAPSFFRQGISTPGSASTRTGYYQPPVYPMYSDRNTPNNPNSYGHGHHSTYNPVQRHQQRQQYQFLSNNNHHQMRSPQQTHSSCQRSINGAYHHHFSFPESFSTCTSRRTYGKHNGQRSPNSSPGPTTVPRNMRYNNNSKEEMTVSSGPMSAPRSMRYNNSREELSFGGTA